MAKRGPKERVWTEQEKLLVKFMSVCAKPHKQIAKAIGTNDKTLRKHFKEELNIAADSLDAQVVGALFKNAMRGNVAAQIFWVKAKLGWTEKSKHEITGKDGAAVVPVFNIKVAEIPQKHKVSGDDESKPKRS